MVLPLSLLPLTLSYLLFLAGTGLVYFKSIGMLTGHSTPGARGCGCLCWPLRQRLSPFSLAKTRC